MKHARDDYNRIQDPTNAIPENEPVFLIRGQDAVSGDAVRHWAQLNDERGGDPELSRRAREQAAKMDAWPNKKPADL
jgi:hypothetical protein